MCSGIIFSFGINLSQFVYNFQHKCIGNLIEFFLLHFCMKCILFQNFRSNFNTKSYIFHILVVTFFQKNLLSSYKCYLVACERYFGLHMRYIIRNRRMFCIGKGIQNILYLFHRRRNLLYIYIRSLLRFFLYFKCRINSILFVYIFHIKCHIFHIILNYRKIHLRKHKKDSRQYFFQLLFSHIQYISLTCYILYNCEDILYSLVRFLIRNNLLDKYNCSLVDIEKLFPNKIDIHAS